MSVTVSYKGAEIASAENQTKTLLTAGKYMEGDITITDVLPGVLLDHIVFTPESDLTDQNTETFNLTASDSGIDLVIVTKEEESEPAPNYSTALTWHNTCNNTYGITRILRADGTIGTDPNMCTLNADWTQITIGGHWGVFPAGETYHIYKMTVR